MLYVHDAWAKSPPKYVYDFLFICRASEPTIYEIYKRNIAQIVIKNVRRTRAGRKQTKEAEARVIEDAIIMVDKLIKHE